MCGIMGYVGEDLAVPILLNGLGHLEYRGYDSSGIALILNEEIEIHKKVGKLACLQEDLSEIKFNAKIGIGHTRWATHGRPSDENAHPHADCKNRFAVVHNGIIENYLALKSELIKKGHLFRSETDTEVLSHLIEEYYDGDLLNTVLTVIKKLRGSYALVVLSVDNPDTLIAVRQDSPLVVGLGENGNFLASDIPAILSYTKNTYILADGEIAILKANQVKIVNKDKEEIKKEVFEVKWEASQAEKDGFDHFMLKEIYEQPKALKDTLSGRISSDGKKIELKEISLSKEELNSINKIYVVACGTAYHAGLVGKQVIEKLARLPVIVEIASEFRYQDPMVDDKSLVIVISQSGETADTLAAMREAQKRGAKAIAITNVVDSTVARDADYVLYTWAGPEIAVASTKAYTTQLMVLYLLGLFLAQERETISVEEILEINQEIRVLVDKIKLILDNSNQIKSLVEEYSNVQSAFFIGRGLDYVVAQEGALKLKEISYIHAEAYAAGELKHGTLALIIKEVLVIALITQKKLFEKTLSNIKEVKAREAMVLVLAFEDQNEIEDVVDKVVYIPNIHPILAPVLSVVPLQLFAYYMAISKGNDVDQPRNLAKSVTVE